MPRARPIFPVALSPQSASKALGIPYRLVRDALYVTHQLPAHVAPSGGRVRVLVRDLETWCRTWPAASLKKRKSKRSVPDGDA